MSPLRIRPYGDGDLRDVVTLWETVFQDDPPWNAPQLVVKRKLGTQRELFLVGCLDDLLVATVLGGFDGFRGWVYHLAVSPEHRRKGLGKAMMADVEDRLHALGCPKVNLQVRATNQAVVDFYDSLGYATEDRVSMGKHLDPTRRTS